MPPDRSAPPPPRPPPPPPPRTLDVQKFAEARAPELESLHSIVSARLGHDFRIRRSKRKRTTGYRNPKNRRRKRRKLGDAGSAAAKDAERKDPTTKRVPRRVRRRIELRKNPASGFCTSGDGTKRLRTHLWHAKRFTMVKRWGFYLPLGLQGRGRGSRAVLKWLKFGALVHDAGYCHPIQLEGPQDSIMAVLRMVLLPSPSSVLEEISHSVAHGVCYKTAMLYHVESSLSQVIAPVMYMWRPFLKEDNHINAEENNAMRECKMSIKSGCCVASRQLWIWVHAAAFLEGLDALKIACQKQMHISGISVSCFSLEGRIAKLDIMGSKATQILQKTLHPISELCSTSDHCLSRCSYLTSPINSVLQKPSILKHAEHLPCHGILSLTVHDPRDLPSKETELASGRTRAETDLKEEDIQNSNVLTSEVSTENEDLLLSLWSKPEANGIFISDSKDLWDSSNSLKPPIPENILCADKHHRRLNFFYLNPANHGSPASEASDGFVRSCSVLLLKHGKQGNFDAGWSIVLPLSWINVYWLSLISHGAHAIGLRERRWIASNVGLPSFPFDFPDCEAYSSLMTAEAAEADKSAELRPLAVRPLRVPIPPPWNCILSTFKKGHGMHGDFQNIDKQHYLGEAAPASSLESEQQTSQQSPSDQKGAFYGFIPRISTVLSEYLEKIHSGSLASMLAQRGLCLVRVLIHALKEGVFEEGAIVCAPALSDLTHWESRVEDHESLQMPQSLVRSYFSQLDSGKWEIRLPEDCSTQESQRCPIGFVTTGFVRGSGKPVAQAFCEVKLLAQLREQQSRCKARPEILVLVRNRTSAAHRRGLLTIVLEQEKEDLEFM